MNSLNTKFGAADLESTPVDQADVDTLSLVESSSRRMSKPCGATGEDWAHFDGVLGLTEDLLPTVCNTDAQISPRSNLTRGHIGRVPCMYDARGFLVGIPGWTKANSTGDAIKRWMEQPDYGICVVTRRVRGFDIDVTVPKLADAIARTIERVLGVKIPTRRREGTAKRLLAVRIEGSHGKRRLQVAGKEFIEFLGTGQMFVAAGSRADGSRYYWDGGLPDEVPAITAEELDRLWQILEQEFGQAASVISQAPGESRADLDVEDPVGDWLLERGLVLGERTRGLVVACPWEEDHSGGETGDGSTMWMLAGGKGHKIGHFRCMHNHCAHRSRGDYLAAVGYQEDISDCFEARTTEVEESVPDFKRNKDGSIKAIINNIVKGVASGKCAGMVVAHDEFRDEIMWRPVGSDGWQRFTDVDYTRLQMKLERWGFNPIPKELLRAAVEEVARRNTFDSAIHWLRQKVPKWDGLPRVETFLIDYWGAEDNPYHRAVACYIWSALAARVLEPGCKADMVPIFVGPQGSGKSTGVSALAPTEESFAEISLHDKEDDLSRRLKGKLVVELGELRGLHTRELEAIKAWITRRIDAWVPKYKEFATQYPRRWTIFGTTNQDQFLADSTGNRRFLPVKVTKVSSFKHVLLQLWAEAREIFLEKGVQFADAERLAGPSHEEHSMPVPMREPIRRWLLRADRPDGSRPIDRQFITTSEVAEEALCLKPDRPNAKRNEMEIGDILRNYFGYVRQRMRDNGERVYVYVRTTPPVPTSALPSDERQGHSDD